MTRRVISWALVGLYSLVASGLPLPLGIPPAGERVAAARLAAKDRSRPFPCMDKACGCATAEQCLTSCCCHTPAEQLAWARARKLEPAVLVALARRVMADPASTKPAGGCCAAKAPRQPACCSSHPDTLPHDLTDEPEVCADYQSLAAEPIGDDSDPTTVLPSSDDPTHVPSRIRTVTLQAMLACGGILTQWLTVGGSLPPLKVEVARPLPPLVGRLILADDHACAVLRAPDTPPPRA